jgi:hypothetical protein
LDFTVCYNKQVYELCVGGKDIPVTHLNVEQYLDALAKWEIRDKFDQVF